MKARNIISSTYSASSIGHSLRLDLKNNFDHCFLNGKVQKKCIVSVDLTRKSNTFFIIEEISMSLNIEKHVNV